jgi:putative membrane protein
VRGFVFARGGMALPRPTPVERLVAFVIRWLITAAGVWVASELVGGIHVHGAESTLAVALILGLLNAYLKPLLVVGTLPALLMTAGLFLIMINTVLLALTGWIAGRFGSIQFDIDGFWAALWGAVIISVVSFFISLFVSPDRIARNFRG